MGIETFYMTHSQTAPHGVRSGPSSNASSNAASTAGKGNPDLASSSTLGFFDMFLQTAAAALETQSKKSSNAKESSADNILDMPISEVDENSPIAGLLQAMSGTKGVAEELAKMDNPTIADVISLHKQALEQGILPETQSDIDVETAAEIEVAVTDDENGETAPDILQGAFLIEDTKQNRPALNNLARMLKRLEQLMNNEDSSLIAANLTPQQMSELKEKVENLLAGIQDQQSDTNTQDNGENYAGFVLGLIRLLPPQSKNDLIASSKAVVIGDIALNSDAKTIGTKDLTAQVNGNVTGDKGAPSWNSNDLAAADDFESFLDSMKSEKGTKASSLGELMSDKAGNDNGLKAGVGLNGVLKNWPFGNSGNLLSPAEFSQSALQQMGLSTAQTPLSTLASMTSVVTQSQAASLPHPGTQMVAANLQKLASNGETKNIRVQLDPPELGRVEIKMSFGKDKSVKAILTAEKPETFMMLQRDSQMLERALQEAGLDADSSSLSFELAQDNQNFNQDGSHDGARNKAGKNGDGSDEEIIEATMTWQVDPQTGHMRYNIMA